MPPFHHHTLLHPQPLAYFSSRGWGWRGWWKGGMAQFFSCRGRGWRGWWKGWHGTKPFFRSDTFFYLQFKNTSNMILLGFKMLSERFLFEDFKTGLTFWHMWFFNFQNLLRTCQHIDGTPCKCSLWTPPYSSWLI